MSSVVALSDQELRMTMRELVGRERSALLDVVDHLAEVEARELHLVWGYASLWAYCEKELGLEEGVAHQRITLARIFRRKPEVRGRVVDGKIGAYAATLLRDFLDAEDFAEILRSAEGMSKRALEDHLAARRTKPVARKDTIRRVAPVMHTAAVTQATIRFDDAPMPQREAEKVGEVRTHRIGFVATEAFVEKLRRAQDVAGTSDLSEVLAKALDAYLDKQDPLRREARRQKRQMAAKAQKRKSARKDSNAVMRVGADSSARGATQAAAATQIVGATQARAAAATQAGVAAAAATQAGVAAAAATQAGVAATAATQAGVAAAAATQAAAAEQRVAARGDAVAARMDVGSRASEASSAARRPRRTLGDAVVVRDDARCTYRAPDGTRCSATRHIQRDHVRPWALGGATSEENLRVLCRAHNLMLARRTFGPKVPRSTSHV